MTHFLDTMRHNTIFNAEKFGNKKVTVVGAGATGSKIVMELAKLGVKNIEVYDFDKIESHNIPNQLFGNHQVGQYKVDALAEIVKEYTGTEIITKNEAVVDQELGDIVFLLTDTMSSRKEIYENCIQYQSKDFFIETRMGVDSMRIYTIDGMNLDKCSRWENTLCGDDVAEVSACGTSITVGATAGILACQAIWQFIRKVSGKEVEEELMQWVETPTVIANKW